MTSTTSRKPSNSQSEGFTFFGVMPPLLPSSADALSIPHPLALRTLLRSLPQLAPRSNTKLLPTRTIPPLDSIRGSLASLFRRQITTITATATAPATVSTTTSPSPSTNTAPIIPAHYAGLNSGPTPGTVVGIVLGSVAGFLLILWLIYTCFGLAGRKPASSVVEEEVITRRRSRSPSRRRSSPRRPPSSHSASEVMEVRSVQRERTPPPRRESRRETVIIEETRRPAPPEDDYVEVIEEHSPVRRESRRKSSAGGAYRHVDPEAFAGGARPSRKVSRR